MGKHENSAMSACREFSAQTIRTYVRTDGRSRELFDKVISGRRPNNFTTLRKHWLMDEGCEGSLSFDL